MLPEGLQTSIDEAFKKYSMQEGLRLRGYSARIGHITHATASEVPGGALVAEQAWLTERSLHQYNRINGTMARMIAKKMSGNTTHPTQEKGDNNPQVQAKGGGRAGRCPPAAQQGSIPPSVVSAIVDRRSVAKDKSFPSHPTTLIVPDKTVKSSGHISAGGGMVTSYKRNKTNKKN